MKKFFATVMAGAMVWAASPTVAAEEKTKIVLVAGKASHGPGDHEHRAGSMLLAKCLNENMPNVEAVVVTEGWPEDASVFDGAAAVVMYCDGGRGHMVNPHMDTFGERIADGVGLVCIHYAVEVPKGDEGDVFLDWLGGYFETHWSVNPHWTAEFAELPAHPITRGVEPFTIHDEWYFHMRFREGMEGVTPILSAHPPESTMSRPDGAHSGNPHVREALERGEAQHVAWAYERPDGGRSFGFTGAHFHRNWADDDFRTVVLNAIVWSAGLEVPEGGVPSPTPTEDEMKANMDPK